MPSEVIIVAVLANVAVVVAAWISSHRKLTHITEVTNSNLEAANAKADELDEELRELREVTLREALERIRKLEDRLSEERGGGRSGG